jgi:hypothetical protein
MVLLPGATPLAKPVLLITATAGFEELQIALSVKFWVLPSLYIPVALNCCVLPFTIDGSAEASDIDVKLAGVPFVPVP